MNEQERLMLKIKKNHKKSLENLKETEIFMARCKKMNIDFKKEGIIFNRIWWVTFIANVFFSFVLIYLIRIKSGFPIFFQ